MFVTAIVTFILFEILDFWFDIKIKYFSLVAKNKLLFYIVYITYPIILFVLVIIKYPFSNYFNFVLTIIYFSIFLSLYHHVTNFQKAHNVYIKNVDKLLKVKQKDRNKRKTKK